MTGWVCEIALHDLCGQTDEISAELRVAESREISVSNAQCFPPTVRKMMCPEVEATHWHTVTRERVPRGKLFFRSSEINGRNSSSVYDRGRDLTRSFQKYMNGFIHEPFFSWKTGSFISTSSLRPQKGFFSPQESRKH